MKWNRRRLESKSGRRFCLRPPLNWPRPDLDFLVVHYFQLSAFTRRARRLRGERVCKGINRRDAENAKAAQR